jgi:hypothetical protein
LRKSDGGDEALVQLRADIGAGAPSPTPGSTAIMALKRGRDARIHGLNCLSRENSLAPSVTFLSLCLDRPLRTFGWFATRFAQSIRGAMTAPAAQNAAGDSPPPAQVGRVVFIAFLGLAAIAWIGIAVSANARTPGIVGVLAAVVGGFFLAVLIAAIGGGIALKLATPADAKPHPLVGGDDLGPELTAMVFDLEARRLSGARQAKERSAWRVPACAGVGLCLWTLLALAGAPVGLADFLLVMILGGLVGFLWSAREVSRQYARFYRERVMPRLAASFGEITWRPAVMPDLDRLRSERIFRAFGRAHAKNELAGTYRGLPVHIVELRLDNPEEGRREPVFDGLIIDIGLRRDIGAALAIVAEGGSFGNITERMRESGRERVALSEPKFNTVFEAYASDPAAAGALLEPALVDTLLKLGSLKDFATPVMICTGDRLTIAAPKRASRSLFASPSFAQRDASRETLVRLSGDISAALAVAAAIVAREGTPDIPSL